MFQKAGESTLKDGVIKDCMGNLYYPKPGQKIDVKQGVQTSKDQTGKGENSGFYSIAYIDHGIAPKGDCYEYGIGLLVGKLQYSILQQDRTVISFNLETPLTMPYLSESFKNKVAVVWTICFSICREKNIVKCWACQPIWGYTTMTLPNMMKQSATISVYSGMDYNP